MSDMNVEKLDQVAAQCRVVVHLCSAMIDLYKMHSELFASHNEGHAALADMLGERTAHLMEYLGDHLNEIDAVTGDDEWTDAIYARAHELFPVSEESK